MDTYSLVTLLSLRFRAREERRRVARTIPFSLSLSLDDRKTPLPSNFSIKHSRDAKFGREEILARVSSASSPTCLFLFIRPGDSPAGARLCRWLQKINKKKKKKKGEGGIRTRTSISRDISRGKLYYLDARLTGGRGEGGNKKTYNFHVKLQS